MWNTCYDIVLHMAKEDVTQDACFYAVQFIYSFLFRFVFPAVIICYMNVSIVTLGK